MPRHAVPRLLQVLATIVATACILAVTTIACAAAREGPAAIGGSVELQPATGKASTRRLVFSCITPGHVTFSDRPCGPATATRELLIRAEIATKPHTADQQAGRTSSVASEPARESARERASGDERLSGPSPTENDAATCQRLAAAVATLDVRMRGGYSAREAGRLWDRWREAKSRLREADC